MYVYIYIYIYICFVANSRFRLENLKLCYHPVLCIKERLAPYNGGCELGNFKIDWELFFPSAQNLFENLRHRSVQSLYAGRNYSKTFSELIE